MIGIRVADREYSKTGEAEDVSVMEEGEGAAAPTNVADIDVSKLGFFDD